MLLEIHKSKISYSSYKEKKDQSYDAICTSLQDITTAIQAARESIATKQQKIAYDKSIQEGIRKKMDEFLVDPLSIPVTDVVIRVMTWDHIPLIHDPKIAERKWDDDIDSQETEYDEKVLAAPTKKQRLNFPPYQHYRFDENTAPYCVGKSHWKGDLESGEFCKEHGKMTNELAKIFKVMCERYVSKANFRNYSYADEMVSQGLLQLSQVGLQFDESKGTNAFAYITTVIHNAFIRVLNSEKKNQVIRDEILEENGYNPSYTRQNESFDDDEYS